MGTSDDREPQSYAAELSGKLDGIAHQIKQNLAQTHRVTAHDARYGIIECRVPGYALISCRSSKQYPFFVKINP
jgi:hypothetical protein